MMFHRLPEKKTYKKKTNSNSENSKLQNLIHFDEHGISCIGIRVVSKFDAASKCYKRVQQF